MPLRDRARPPIRLALALGSAVAVLAGCDTRRPGSATVRARSPSSVPGMCRASPTHSPQMSASSSPPPTSPRRWIRPTPASRLSSMPWPAPASTARTSAPLTSACSRNTKDRRQRHRVPGQQRDPGQDPSRRFGLASAGPHCRHRRRRHPDQLGQLLHRRRFTTGERRRGPRISRRQGPGRAIRAAIRARAGQGHLDLGGIGRHTPGARAPAGRDAVRVPLEPGQQTVSFSVTAVWELR